MGCFVRGGSRITHSSSSSARDACLPRRYSRLFPGAIVPVWLICILPVNKGPHPMSMSNVH